MLDFVKKEENGSPGSAAVVTTTPRGRGAGRGGRGRGRGAAAGGASEFTIFSSLTNLSWENAFPFLVREENSWQCLD